jgi:glycosyltransferase involved in cell wall biosynthesis
MNRVWRRAHSCPRSGVPRRAVILYRSIPQYREPFYDALRDLLRRQDIEFLLLFGDSDNSERSKLDSVDVAWATRIRNRIWRIGNRTLYWQPALRHLRRGDLVVVEQASKLLVNYPLLILQTIGWIRLAYWGHGRNFRDASSSRVGEWLKAWTSKRVHWWFAYNARSATVLEALPYPASRITDVQNAIDSVQVRVNVEAARRGDLLRLRKTVGVKSDNVGLFMGAMYAEKHLDFLIDAAHEIRSRVPDFELLLVGAGPAQTQAEVAAECAEWIHYVGPRFGAERTPYLAASRVLLMPGLVGLVALDALAAGVPLVTRDLPFHSPEIAYLTDGENARILSSDVSPSEYAEAVTLLLQDHFLRDRLAQTGRVASSHLTIDNMAERFSRGVYAAFNAERMRL